MTLAMAACKLHCITGQLQVPHWHMTCCGLVTRPHHKAEMDSLPPLWQVLRRSLPAHLWYIVTVVSECRGGVSSGSRAPGFVCKQPKHLAALESMTKSCNLPVLTRGRSYGVEARRSASLQELRSSKVQSLVRSSRAHKKSVCCWIHKRKACESRLAAGHTQWRGAQHNRCGCELLGC
jgi:hypothetical protein